MENSLAQKAIGLAISGDWEEALKINLQIVDKNPQDLDALNRLARCHFELGNVNAAVETSEKVLKIDPSNSIAQKCLQKWHNGKRGANRPITTVTAELFLEESGRTKLIQLVNLGSTDVLTTLDSGQEVKLSAYSHKVSVTDMDNKYIGRLPDDLSARIKQLLKGGSKYKILVKAADTKSVSVFIRELENKTGITSFPPEKIDYVTFTPPELVHKDTPDVITQEESAE
jgi:tetratricopeptide (TPR) repeat protein